MLTTESLPQTNSCVLKGDLPRRERHRYLGHAAVFWTFSMEDRATGWLTPQFHQGFREWHLHAHSRQHLICPAYCLMPDHAHFLWIGTSSRTNQLNALRFLRTQFNRALCALTDQPLAKGEPHPTQPHFRLQHQAHDHVLREAEREQDALRAICHYIFLNPVRAELVHDPVDYPYSGAVVPGYPTLNPHQDTFWPLFWDVLYRAQT